MMVIYPDIEILGGKAVNLHRGFLDQPVYFDVSPLDAALDFERQGAQCLHVVDLDGVEQGGRHNGDVICEIIDRVGIPVHVGGGIRTLHAADWWLDHGAARLVVGTAAVVDRGFLSDICVQHPGKIIASIDAFRGNVWINGWREETALTPLEVCRELQNSGVDAIIYTDIDVDVEEPGATLAHTMQIAEELSIPVISSGTVKSLDDISRLQLLPGIAGVVTGRALFNGWFSLVDALKIARQSQALAEVA